jgi:ribokinase
MSMIDVLCIGDLDVDMFISVPEIPGFDQKVSGRNRGQMPGGMSANCAVAVARLGLNSRLLAAVGRDASGAFAVGKIRGEGVDVDHLVYRDDADTFMCVVMLSPSGEKSLIKLETDAYLPRPGEVTADAFEGVRHLHLTYGQPELARVALSMAAERGLSTSLDLEPPDIVRNPHLLRSILPMVDTLFLNREALGKAESALGEALVPAHLRQNGEIIVTLGAGGCRRLAAGSVEEVPGFEVRTVDTTGAGDCFAGAYLAARLTGVEPVDAMTRANAAAALATLEVGSQTGMPDRAAVEAFMLERIGRSRETSAETSELSGELHA